jgi:hypothetical protein
VGVLVIRFLKGVWLIGYFIGGIVLLLLAGYRLVNGDKLGALLDLTVWIAFYKRGENAN